VGRISVPTYGAEAVERADLGAPGWPSEIEQPLSIETVHRCRDYT
jgi:hypothetical protein